LGFFCWNRLEKVLSEEFFRYTFLGSLSVKCVEEEDGREGSNEGGEVRK